MVDITFGEWLKRQRKAMGLTQEGLANQVGCSTIAIRKIEAEERRPSAQIAERIANIFGVSQNDQKDFLRFARGDAEFTPADRKKDTPWRVLPVRTNLPSAVASLVGREKEIADTLEYLRRTDIRLVTFVGPPGIGKTRLSLEAARASLSDFPDGVFFVALAPLDEALLVAPAILQALGFVEAPNQSASKQLTAGIEGKRILLVLDNCEHLIEDVASLASGLLSACSRLKIIATSREALRIPGEWLYTVPTLGIPQKNLPVDVGSIPQFSALTLFVERACAANSDFKVDAGNIQAVTSICAQLDGLPLAIELIAARIRFMSPQTLLERMTSQFVLSADGMRAVSARQKTLNNAIGWSYKFLSLEEQKMFACLSVFSGGFTLEAAEAIFLDSFADKPGSDLVALLSDKSLLQRDLDERGEIRFAMLVTIRQFALEHLQSMGEEENIRGRHLKYFVQFSEQAGRELVGPQQMEWRPRLLEERDNLRSALVWAARHSAEEGMCLAANLGSRFWENFNIQEGIRWLTEFLQRPETQFKTKARVSALNVLAYLQFHFQKFDLMRLAAESALEVSRSICDTEGECDSLIILGSAMQFLEGMEAKSNFQMQSLLLARSIGDVRREAEALSSLSWDKRDLKKAFGYREQSIQLYRQAGDWQGLAHALSLFASDIALSGDAEHAERILDEYAKLNQQSSDKRNKEFLLTTKARIALHRGEYCQARAYLEECMAVLKELGNRMGYLWARTRFGYVVLREGKLEAAKEIILDCLHEFQKDGNRTGLLFPLELMAMCFVQADQPERAARLIGWTENVRQAIGDSMFQIAQPDWAKTMNSILVKLGKDNFESLRKSGAAMTSDGIITYVLDEL